MLRNDLYQPWFVDEKWGFEILSGEYQSTVVEIEKLDFKPDSKEELDLEYHIVNKPEVLAEEDLKTEKFYFTVQLILNDILKEAIETYEQTRTDDPEKSSS